MKNKQKVSSDKFTMMTQMPVNKLICKMAVPTIITMLVSAVSGKKVTVLLEASDRSFFREFSVDKCPSKDDAS